MIIHSDSELITRSPMERTAMSGSFLGALARSINVSFDDLPSLFGRRRLVEGDGYMSSKWSVPVGFFAMLNPLFEAIRADACSVIDNGPMAVEPSAIVYGWAVAIDAITGPEPMTFEDLEQRLKPLSAILGLKRDADERSRAVAKYNQFLPSHSSIEALTDSWFGKAALPRIDEDALLTIPNMIDNQSVPAMVARMACVQRSDLIEAGYDASTSNKMLAGKATWSTPGREVIVERLAEMHWIYRDANMDRPGDELPGEIADLWPAEVATFWQLVPSAQFALIEGSQWIHVNAEDIEISEP